MSEPNVWVVDVLVQIRASSFEPRFTYQLNDDIAPLIGAIVRVPVGRKEYYGYVVGVVAPAAANPKLRRLIEVLPLPPAFTRDGLALAEWLAQTYCCTLSEALNTIVYTNAVPRTIERIIPIERAAATDREGIPERLLAFLFEDAHEGIALEELLRHPEARRAADRPTLRKAVTRMVALGAVRRERITAGPAVAERTTRQLKLGTTLPQKGPKLAALREFIAGHAGGLAYATALEAGFSRAVISRAVATAVLEEYRAEDTPFAPKAPPAEGLAAHEQLIPTSEQAAALAKFDVLAKIAGFHEVLVHGITGSGKTYVYLEAVRRVVAAGDGAIILVPEIALTPQTALRFRNVFGGAVVVLHSGLSERERFDAWRAAARGAVQVVVGARSAVFVPLPRVKLIVVDEAHETTYRQEQNPRYHAIAVARERMRRSSGMLVLGSATPPLELYARAKLGQIELLELHSRATQAPLPQTEIIDLAAEARGGRKHIFSTRLITVLDQVLQKRQKAVLFVSHRGTARFLLCRECGYVPTCRRCSLSLTFHRIDQSLRCHLCDALESPPSACPRCGHAPLAPLGLGTERVTTELQTLFPAANIVRMDSDTTTRQGDHTRLLDLFAEQGDILVGTQMIAKGLDFPTVTLAAVVAADVGLHIADYRASERTFSVLTQVSGRSGRNQAGLAIIQTYLPEHPAIVFAAAHDYEGFAKSELAERRLLQYPPFVRLTYLTIAGRARERVESVTHALAEELRTLDADWLILGPAFAPVPRINDEWRMRVALKTARLEPVREILRTRVLPKLRKEHGVRYILELDV